MPPRKSTASTATKSPARSPSTSSSASTPSKPRARSRSTSAKKSNKLSEHLYLLYAAYAIAAIFVGFGLNAIFRPQPALVFFELDYPLLPKQQTAVDLLSAVYGSRDVFVGAAIAILARRAVDRKTLGAVIVGAGALGFFDGVVTALKVGKGHWNHFSWAPLVSAIGAVLLGAVDK